VNRV
jgi:hypothetical protein